jgi:hypothetical protein
MCASVSLVRHIPDIKSRARHKCFIRVCARCFVSRWASPDSPSLASTSTGISLVELLPLPRLQVQLWSVPRSPVGGWIDGLRRLLDHSAKDMRLTKMVS